MSDIGSIFSSGLGERRTTMRGDEARRAGRRPDETPVKAVRAAGGVVYRQGPSGRHEVLVVYRLSREDWTFPKGKLRRDEEHEACARREVEEETGLRCSLGVELPSTSYVTRSGRPKRVRYWAMRPVAGSVRPQNEVDEARWVGLAAAAALLTYGRDRALLLAFARLARGRVLGHAIGSRKTHRPSLQFSSRGLGRPVASRAGRVRTA
jgi:8-oxo-dGTP diphosphatase